MKGLQYFYLRVNTIKYLTSTQIFYQLRYRLKRFMRNRPFIPSKRPAPVTLQLEMRDSISSQKSWHDGSFTFLNVKHKFFGEIDWNINAYGKLWVYNLNYFDYLLQKSVKPEEACIVLDSFIHNSEKLTHGVEPYPISVRGINWIKFFCYNRIKDDRYNSLLYSHYQFLINNLEYHLLGNHLLENGFSLLFASVYFNDLKFDSIAERILRGELNEQILDDGAHFELSPMYHQIILFRILDCINLLQNNSPGKSNLKVFLIEKAASMLGWLKEVTFNNGDIPMVNDSAAGIAPTTGALLKYAQQLGVSCTPSPLRTSGYRMIRFDDIEMLVDVGNIGPDYIPGHAHSDTFNFVLYKGGIPIIVETGTSTYENNDTRRLERSTRSHNTVLVDAKDQSEVWSSFRVGKRARVISLSEAEDSISAIHDGYKGIGVLHQRCWKWDSEGIIIEDILRGNKKDAEAYLHFHPDVAVDLTGGALNVGGVNIQFGGEQKIALEEYNFATGFNKTRISKKIKVSFQHTLSISISFRSGLPRFQENSSLQSF
jgi:hypothetical protein